MWQGFTFMFNRLMLWQGPRHVTSCLVYQGGVCWWRVCLWSYKMNTGWCLLFIHPGFHLLFRYPSFSKGLTVVVRVRLAGCDSELGEYRPDAVKTNCPHMPCSVVSSQLRECPDITLPWSLSSKCQQMTHKPKLSYSFTLVRISEEWVVGRAYSLMEMGKDWWHQ